MSTALHQELHDTFGGSWHGDHPEIHGLLHVHDHHFQVELLAHRDDWIATVFVGGVCLGSGRHQDALDACRIALEAVANAAR